MSTFSRAAGSARTVRPGQEMRRYASSLLNKNRSKSMMAAMDISDAAQAAIHFQAGTGMDVQHVSFLYPGDSAADGFLLFRFVWVIIFFANISSIFPSNTGVPLSLIIYRPSC